jgi:hypothetical protein
MRRMSDAELYRCNLCQREVDADTRDRARHAWQPLIICEGCIREADVKSTSSRPQFAAAAS